ncbi:hypothetical protein [Cetobacterium somerae]
MEEKYDEYGLALTIVIALIGGTIAFVINYTNSALNNFLINLRDIWIFYPIGCALLSMFICGLTETTITNLKIKKIIIRLLYLISFFLVQGTIVLLYVKMFSSK